MRRANGDVVTVDVSSLVDAITEGVEEKIRDAAKDWDPSVDEVVEVIQNNGWTMDELGFDLADIDVSEIVSEHSVGDLMNAIVDYHGVVDALDATADTQPTGWAHVMMVANNRGDESDRERFLCSLKGKDNGGLLAYVGDAFALLDGQDQHTFLSSENVRREYEKMGTSLPKAEAPDEARPRFIIDLPPEAFIGSSEFNPRARADFMTNVMLEDVRMHYADGPEGVARVVWTTLTPQERVALMAHVFSTLMQKADK